MSTDLHKVVEKYCEQLAPQYRALAAEIIEAKIYKEVLRQEEVKIDRLHETHRAALEKERIIAKIDEAWNALFVAGVLGFLIGMLVNQSTELVLLLKKLGVHWDQHFPVTTIICVVIIGVSIWGVFQYLFIQKIKKSIARHYGNEQSNGYKR